MPRETVEQLVGKLMTNDAFRADFFKDPQTSAHAEGFHLSDEEITSLKGAQQILTKAGDDISQFVQGPGGAAAVLDIHVHSN
ncbi:hypothetical protein CN154_33180 [Sinorhizobium meliloti]|uniref:Os1348 family NHLP clan protein n=1 Tax=Rhizobium meliloti TaxID=382 RepID=UPI000FD6EB0A|nr:Os1348 family NHLP clan protein [Sinorhizobium meliloti]MDE3775649.1 hypothetical protein [Sinorhizobium meliloti]RVK64333.1 hypothetical protein CN154_33180 [Sinorhizobium meliloti]